MNQSYKYSWGRKHQERIRTLLSSYILQPFERPCWARQRALKHVDVLNSCHIDFQKNGDRNWQEFIYLPRTGSKVLYLVYTEGEVAKQQWMKRWIIVELLPANVVLFNPATSIWGNLLFEYNFALWHRKKLKVGEIS